MKTHEKIRVLREGKHWSQEHMANQLCMSANGYAKIERGETRLYLDKLEQIAQVLDMDMIELLSSNESTIINQNSMVFCMNEYGNNTNSNYYNSNQDVSIEVEKLKISLHYLEKLLAEKDKTIQDKDKQIELLNQLLTK